MKITQAGVTTGLTLLASVAATLLPELVNEHVLSSSLAAIIGGVVTSLAAGWHGNAAVQKRTSPVQLAAVPTVGGVVDVEPGTGAAAALAAAQAVAPMQAQAAQ